MAGAEILFSVPKLLIIVTQIVSIVNIIYSKKITRNGFIAVITLLYIFVISLIDSNIVASLVGLWGIIPIFLGYHSARIIFESVKERKTNNIVYAVFYLSCLGVFLNILVNYPWYDVSYQIAGMDVSSAQIGTTGGYTRYAGFFKSSLQASSNIFIVLLYIVASTKNKLHILICFLLSLLVSLITISKTTFALHLILLLYVFVKALPVKLLWRGTLLVGILISVFTILSTNYSFEMSDDSISIMLLGSLNARLTTTWPDGVNAIMNSGNLIFGGGLGTIGVGSKLGMGEYNPGDSMYLYIIGTGGYILALLLLFWANYQAIVLDNSPISRFISMTLIVLCLFGISMTTPEYPLMGFALGMVFNARVYNKLREN
ncbi:MULTISPECIES: hypothetical protein [Klebsiella]|uniref:hypothetical protein n=1 Tax=Klebsiella TaxID=570 RepID=UPI001362C56A|nr:MULTISPECIES: hypothetical protein [Klebsiella]MCW9527902.1 hypothetical protein [Klebsiella grimontii]QHI86955.1 hypothetical protein GUC22_08540 [Klebsiella sp. MPUS7]